MTRDPEAFAWIAAPRAGKLVHAGFKGTAAMRGRSSRLRYGINNETAVEGREKTIAAFDAPRIGDRAERLSRRGRISR